jgi:hypothetical protein
MAGSYAGDYVHIGVNANSNVTATADAQMQNLAVTDTTVGASGSLTINAGVTVDVAGYIRLGAGGAGTINVEGNLNVGGHFDYDGNAALSGSGNGVYGQLNVSGDGVVQGGQHMIFGGYSAAYHWDVSISGNATIEGGLKPVYIGGTQGTGQVTMSGNAKLQNTDGDTGYYDNILNVGWSGIPDSGVLTVESGNTVKFRHIEVKSGGKVNFILDAAGQACVLTAELQANEAPGDCFMMFDTGSLIDLDDSGVAAGVLVAGFAVDIATAPEWNMLRWDTAGTYEATLADDDLANWWRLREKPGDATTLQAYIIPEPTTLALLGLGGLLAALRRRS